MWGPGTSHEVWSGTPLYWPTCTLPYCSFCVYGTSESIICCRLCQSSSHSPSDSPTLVPLPSPPSPTLNISCNEYMAKFTLNEGTHTLTTHYFESPRCKLLSLAAGLEGEKVDIGHTHPVCGVFFIPHFDQLVRDPIRLLHINLCLSLHYSVVCMVISGEWMWGRRSESVGHYFLFYFLFFIFKLYSTQCDL